MKRLMVLCNSTVSLFLLCATSLRFKMKGINEGSKYIHKTFYLFGGLPGSLASKLLAKKKNFSLEKLRHDHFDSGTSIHTSSKSLKSKGYFVEKSFLDPTKIKSILEYSLSTQGSYRAKDSGEGNIPDVIIDRMNPKSVRFDYSPTTVLKCRDIQTVLANEKVLSLAQEYLGCQPILDFVAMWWHTKSVKADKKAAQLFHFDMDRLRWVKFFFYVTDVNSDNGPHVFVESTHKDFGIPFSLRRKGYSRLEDEKVEKVISRDRWIEFTGSAGTMIAEDTRGLHKGAHVKEGDRLLFQFQFTSSLYGEAEEPDLMVLRDSELTEELKSAMSNYPYIFQKIRLN
jgi:hypothetical protein